MLPLSLLNGVGALPLTQFSVVQVGTYQELKKKYDDPKQDGKMARFQTGIFNYFSTKLRESQIALSSYKTEVNL